MGPALGRLKGVIRAKNFNVEERAFKAISKNKPTPAPTHTKMVDMMEQIKRDPELLSRGRLDPKTMENLSQVFVTSRGDNPIIETKKRKLPEKRGDVGEFEYGFEEPKVIPQGKASMKQVLEILNLHQTKPSEHTAERLAADFNLNVEDVRNMLKHFRPFHVFIPKKEKKREKISLQLLQKKMEQLKE